MLASSMARGSTWPGDKRPAGAFCLRSSLRVLAAVANASMLSYIYVSHLGRVGWSEFGSQDWKSAQSSALAYHVDVADILHMLNAYTFSEAMLSHLELYFVVSTPMTILLCFLERDRIRWLQAMLKEMLPMYKASRAGRFLETYLRAILLGFAAVLFLTPFHLGLPIAHFCCAGVAFSGGCASICLYLAAPVDFEALHKAASASGDAALQLWVWRVQHRVRPTLKLVVWFHAAAVAAAVLKVARFGDNRAALLFGILETTVVLGYQLVQAVFAVDDIMARCSQQGHCETKFAFVS